MARQKLKSEPDWPLMIWLDLGDPAPISFAVVPEAALSQAREEREDWRGKAEHRLNEWRLRAADVHVAAAKADEAEAAKEMWRKRAEQARERALDEEEAAIEFREARNRFRDALEEIRSKATKPWRPGAAWQRVGWAADIADFALAHDTHRIPVRGCDCPACKPHRTETEEGCR